VFGRAIAVPMGLTVWLSVGCEPRWFGMGRQPSFPAEVNGWQRAGKTQRFDRSTIFDYMNGAGELYLAYDFQRLYVQDYTKPDAPRITAEVYRMSTSEDAYGVFSHDPEGEDLGVGQGNAYAAGLLCFWKGAYFFRILAAQDTPEAKAAVASLGRSLAQPVPEGPLPRILRCLPSEGLEAKSVRYFHTQVSLNAIYYLADANILALSPRTEAVMGTYRRDGEKMLLLIVRYENAQQAEAAYRGLNRVYLKDKPPPDGTHRIETIESGRQVGVLVKGQFLALVLEAKSRPACERLLTEAAGRV